MAGQDDLRGTNSLLAEILDVLRRMDSRLQGQDDRISQLETAIAGGKQVDAILSRVDSNTPSQMSADAYSPTEGSATKQSRRTSIKHVQMPDELHGRRLSARNENRDLLNEPNRADTQEGRKGTSDEKAASALYKNRDQRWGSMANISRQKTWGTVPMSPMDVGRKDSFSDVTDFSASYAQYPPPHQWISTKISGRLLDIRYGLPEAESLWNSYVGDSWSIPPDGRVELSFQRHLLERLEKDQASKLLKLLTEVTNKLEYHNPEDRSKRGSFRVSDFDFDPNYEESGMDYRAEFFTGMYKSRPIPFPREDRLSSSTAYWKRMIEIRGLSRKLIENDEIIVVKDHAWSSMLRDPWAEALPKLNSVCPFFTEREGSLQIGGFNASGIIGRALDHHLKCLPFKASKEDTLCFHVVFYELVNLRDDEDLEGEIWKHGKLHSDDVRNRNRRLRESACTIMVIPDPAQQKYWTSLYLCPFSFDLFEKVPSIISTQDAPSVAADMIEFTIWAVINRWLEIAEYFALLIGHRGTLTDPDSHDSLLFDDDSFSRSRRYFWAINYLAELDDSISGNILQLEHWIAKWPQNLTARSKEAHKDIKPLPERLNQLMALRLRLKALRQEAIALRDGLFSASGVIESRAATRLGENVKLLTFVSIFFLPLSFCMSIWSINDSIFSLSSLAIVGVLLPCVTYFAVFNLNNVVRISSRMYKQFKGRLVSQMKKDADRKWNKQGELFETFRPRSERVEPSDWVLGSFMLHRCIRATGVGNIFSKRGRKQSERQESQLEEHELDFSILNGPRTTIAENSDARGPSTLHGRPTLQGRHSTFQSFRKLSSIFRRGAIVSSSTTGV